MNNSDPDLAHTYRVGRDNREQVTLGEWLLILAVFLAIIAALAAAWWIFS